MNISQKQNILATVDTLKQLNYEQLFIDSFSSESDINSVTISKFTVGTFLVLLRKMTTQLESALQNDEHLLLPNQENFQNDYGTINLEGDISLLLNSLQSRDFAQAEVILTRFIYYQIRNSFWENAKPYQQTVDRDFLDEQKQKIDLNYAALTANMSSYKTLEENVGKKIVEIDSFLNNKQEELRSINSQYSEANNRIVQISEIAGSATNKETEIQGILNNIKDKVDAFDKRVEDAAATQSVIQALASENADRLKVNLDKAESLIKEAQDDWFFVHERKEDIIKLTGMAADGSLGSKFDQRQVKLENGMIFWRWAVPVTTVMALIWAVLVFVVLKAKLDNEWLNLLINLIKTSPGFILMGFVFSQYNKERNLQEEYAFKSAMAMTLTAYSTMLKNEDEDKNKSKQSMLMKSINQIYKQPKLYTEKQEKIISFGTKNLSESVKGLADIVSKINNKE